MSERYAIRRTVVPASSEASSMNATINECTLRYPTCFQVLQDIYLFIVVDTGPCGLMPGAWGVRDGAISVVSHDL